MSTTYTAEDVKKQLAFAGAGDHGEECACYQCKAFDFLRDAALEGAKVPGLEQAVTHWKELADGWEKTAGKELAEVATLTAERDATKADALSIAETAEESERARIKATSERDDAQARVAELERQLAGANSIATQRLNEAVTQERLFLKAKSERDALRDEVAALRGLMSRAADLVMSGGSANYCNAHALLRALSAPTAETTPKERENTCEHGDHPAPAGQRFCSQACMTCEHTHPCGCPVGNTSCSHDDPGGCAGLCGAPAETTPAPDVAAQYAKLVGDVRAVVDGHPCTSADGKTCCALCDALVQVLDAHE